MNKVTWIIFAAVVVLGLGGLITYIQLNSPRAEVSSVNENSLIAASEANGNIADHYLGGSDTKAVLIEYGDFQCPSCGGAHPNIKAITEEYGNDITFVFRNFPLTSIHPNARVAAAAAEAAGLQGKYWDMHNLIFETQNSWNSLTGENRTNKFIDYAGQLGLDKDQFTRDLANSRVNQKISFDQALGQKVKVNSTPTFFLNGKIVSNEVSSGIVQGNTEPLKTELNRALGR